MTSSSSSSSEGLSSSLAYWPFRILSWLLGLVDNVACLLKVIPNAPKFFTKGWNWEKMNKAFEDQQSLLEELSIKDGEYASVTITAKDIVWSDAQIKSGVTLRTASFTSPLADDLPPESKDCHFLLVTPTTNTPSTYIVMLPATGEMGKRERLTMAKQLATQKGWASIIVTAPFYARRTPSGQKRFFLNTVADALVQSQAIIQETASIIRYVMRKEDKETIIPASPSNKVVVTGFSWGSAMSSMSCTTALLAGVDGRRLACAAYVGCSSPELFADGILENGIDWNALLEDKPKTMKSFQGVDVSDLKTPEQAQRALLGILTQVQLATFVDALEKKDPTNMLTNVQMQCMYDDGFISPKYSLKYVDQMQRLTKATSFQLRWMPGGHVLGAMLRPLLHKKAIVEAVQKMEKDS